MGSDTKRVSGMTAFSIIWIGQILSLLGTAVGQFGLRLWVFDASGGQATPMTLIGFFFFVPMVAFTPLVGVLVDRANRKLMMMLSDLAAALTTLFVLILFATGHLQVWHLYITAFITGTFQGFQWPAYSAAITTMLDKKDYTRANAMLETAGNASGVFAPLIAGALIGPLGVWMTRTFADLAQTASGDTGLLALLILDLLSASFAIGSLLFVHIPQPEQSTSGVEARGSFGHQAMYGLRYILARPSLLGLQLVFLGGNFFSSLGTSVWDPMVLARTSSDAVTFGSIQTAGAVGGIIGGIAVGAWGGFKRRVHGVLVGWAFGGLALVAMGVSRSLVPWLVASFLSMVVVPLVNGSNQAIWQAKVPPDVQGRVFATRRLIAWLVSPLAQLAAGPIADRVMEPAFASTGGAGGLLTTLFGTGPGTGMGVQLALAGLLSALVGVAGYLFRAVRDAEAILPDHDAQPAPTPQT
ncbi:MAG: MFS transporter [Anaerolineae bacterium]|nr:MFS transporter [Anaerolineae bacterium]